MGEALHLLPVEVVGLAEGEVLPAVEVQLPELRVGVQGESLGHIDRPGSGHGAVQVAGPHRVHGDVPEAGLQGLDLPEAVVSNQGIVPPVDAAVEVALRLGVADEIDGGQWKSVL